LSKEESILHRKEFPKILKYLKEIPDFMAHENAGCGIILNSRGDSYNGCWENGQFNGKGKLVLD